MTETYDGVQAASEASKAEAVPNPFYISTTTSILERRPRTLKHGDTFAVFDHYGDVSSRGGSPEGIFHKDTRFLSDLQLRVNGQRPLLLSSTVQDNNAVLTADLTNPDLFTGGELELARDTIQIVRSKFLWDGACYERLGVHRLATARTPSSSSSISRQTSLISLSFAAIVGNGGGRSKARAATMASYSCTTASTASFAAPPSDSIRRRRRWMTTALAFTSTSIPARAGPCS